MTVRQYDDAFNRIRNSMKSSQSDEVNTFGGRDPLICGLHGDCIQRECRRIHIIKRLH